MGTENELFVLEIFENGNWIEKQNIELYRSYKIFAMLSDIRNIDNVRPISSFRGFPNDCSDHLKKYEQEHIDDFGGDFGFGYVTIEEIEKYDADYEVLDRNNKMYSFKSVYEGFIERYIDPIKHLWTDSTKARLLFSFR